MNYDFTVKKIVYAGHLSPGMGTPVHKNRKNHGLAFYPNGECVFTFESTPKLVVSAGNIIYMPKGSDYTVARKTPGDCYAINFDIEDDVDFKPFVFKLKDSSACLQNFSACVRGFKKKQSGYNTLLKKELYSIIYQMQKEYKIPYMKKSNNTLDTALNYIHSNYCDEAISIEELADRCEISTVYLRKLFANKFGVSPIQYINNLKLTRAKELLQSGMYSVKDICFLSGFNDESYFNRKFKMCIGMTPLEYAKNNF